MPDPKGQLVTPVAFDVDEDPRSLKVDANDALQVALETPAKGLVGEHGHIGGAWQKQPMMLGFSHTISQLTFDNSLPAGISSTYGAAVPVGEYWLITQIGYWIISASMTNLFIELIIDGVPVTIDHYMPPLTVQRYSRQGFWLLGPGDKLHGRVWGATLNDDINMQMSGTRIDIDL